MYGKDGSQRVGGMANQGDSIKEFAVVAEATGNVPYNMKFVVLYALSIEHRG